MAKWKDTRQFAACKRCGKSLADKPTKQRYCSITCCNIDKTGIERKDCRVYFTCHCGKSGFGTDFRNHARRMCRGCSNDTPKSKNRKYKTCQCGFVGYGTVQFPANAKGKCHRCWKQVQEAKKKEAAALPSRLCKTCGRPIGTKDRRQVVCSKDCASQRLKKKKAVVACCICGKMVERYRKALETRDKFACSNRCQKVWAGLRGAGRLARVGSREWQSAQDKARKKWYRNQSRRRRERNVWFVAVSKKPKRQHSPDCQSWEYRVALRLGSSTGRTRRKKIVFKHSRTVEQALTRLRNRRKYFELTDWQKKVGFKLSSHKARRSRKGEAKRKQDVKGFAGGRQDSEGWSQVCFEWVGD